MGAASIYNDSRQHVLLTGAACDRSVAATTRVLRLPHGGHSAHSEPLWHRARVPGQCTSSARHQILLAAHQHSRHSGAGVSRGGDCCVKSLWLSLSSLLLLCDTAHVHSWQVFGLELQRRLLHVGAITNDILQAYISTIKVLREVDPTGALLAAVGTPVKCVEEAASFLVVSTQSMLSQRTKFLFLVKEQITMQCASTQRIPSWPP